MRALGRSRIILCISAVLGLTLLGGWFAGVRAEAPSEKPAAEKSAEQKPIVLLDSAQFPKNWTFFSADKAAVLADTWSVAEGEEGEGDVLICNGRPFGYLRTAVAYDNFEFSLEWNYPNDPNCNSGILIHTGEEDKIWPASIQVQLHRPEAGSVFPSGGAKSASPLRITDLDLPLKKWHSCVISSRNDTVSVSINGQKLGQVTMCSPRKGSIALQAEGSEIRFRKLLLKKLK